jgi:hypothetical protein
MLEINLELLSAACLSAEGRQRLRRFRAVLLFVLLMLRSLRWFIKSKKGNPTSLAEIELPLLHYSRVKSGIYLPLDASSGIHKREYS